MKIQAKAQKLRKFVKRIKQFSQNQMLANNSKKFFRNLDKEQTLVEKHLREKQQKHFGVPSWRKIEWTTIQQKWKTNQVSGNLNEQMENYNEAALQ